ncbi:alpha/beta fold hydrolase [Granulicoccus phenolivorans]|uniref:alpha/beta fold hydrolase n=1 Tax=Granulicoccus phenolivorans TaxID=266854 RepID=UPI00040AE344|nr:alpha/beta hydrolase [Granulicoccus phenolivorans]
MTTANPEIGQSLRTGDIITNYHDVSSPETADGTPLLLLHGSGPGVSAWANWRLVIERLAPKVRILAPDLAGFGFSEVPDGIEYTRQRWLDQIVTFLDELGVDRVHVVGNSFGGSMALALAIAHPDRVSKLIMMGAVGVPFELTDGLDRVWGYTPSQENMASLMRDTFSYNGDLVTDDMIRARYEASTRPGMQEAFSAMFPAPRQRWVDAMAHPEADIRAITHPTLLVHGRDDKVIPLSTSQTMLDWIDDSQLHVYGRCGHWTQIEKVDPFCRLVADFIEV